MFIVTNISPVCSLGSQYVPRFVPWVPNIFPFCSLGSWYPAWLFCFFCFFVFFPGQTPVFGHICPYGHDFSVICEKKKPYETHICSIGKKHVKHVFLGQ